MITEMGRTTHWFAVDVSDQSQVQLAASQVRNHIGDVDILINNAGIAPCEPFKELTNEKIKRVFDVNIMAHFWVNTCPLFITNLYFFTTLDYQTIFTCYGEK